MNEQIDCTQYCGPPQDGVFCSECSAKKSFAKMKPSKLQDLRIQTERWTGDWKDEKPTFTLREEVRE